MITKELIDRINYLARKKRYEGLTEEEAAEQKNVREIYLEGIRQQVRGQLDILKGALPEQEVPQGEDHQVKDYQGVCSCGKCNNS